MAISHDRLFKELLRTFLREFLELFIPELARHLEPDPPDFLESEIFTDVTAGEKHVADLVARVRVRGQDTCLLVHVEPQAQHQAEFARRMFGYFARLHETYALPVFPVAVLSGRAVLRQPGLDHYEVHAPHRRVLDFHFHRIELKRLEWRSFVNRANPVAAALMSRMRIAKRDRPLVKSACLRIVAGLPLDEARRRLLSGFIDTYLRLDKKETEQFVLEVSHLEPLEAEVIMELTTSWKEEGRKEGRKEGLQEGLALVLECRFGTAAANLALRLSSATPVQLKRFKARVVKAPLEELEKLLC